MRNILHFSEQLNNPNFKGVEFDAFLFEAGSNTFTTSPSKWIETTFEQLVVLSNLESINAVLIHQGLIQSERLIQLNQIAISQMKSLVNSKSMKKLK